MNNVEYMDMVFKAALNEEPNMDALDEAITMTKKAIEVLEELDNA